MAQTGTDLAIIDPRDSSSDLASLSNDELDLRIAEATGHLVGAWKHTLEWAWSLGRYLAEKRRRVKERGDSWLDYVRDCLPFERSQAQNLIDLGEADYQFIGNLPPGTTVTEATLAWQRHRRGPRALPSPREPRRAPLWRAMVDVTPAQVITLMLAVSFPDARECLDPTYGSGKFWDGSAHVNVTGHDILAERSAAGPMDFRNLIYGDQSFDVVTFDPPHNEHPGQNSIMGQRFGTASRELTMAGARECWRVCSMGLIVKVTDQVHGAVWVSESDWVGEALDWHPLYEVVTQVNTTPTPRGWNWGEQYSSYNNCSTYLVFKKGNQRHG